MHPLAQGALEGVVRLEPGDDRFLRPLGPGQGDTRLLMVADGGPGEPLGALMGPLQDEDVGAQPVALRP